MHFDPFRNRLARDIRNSLSKSFLDAIEEKKSDIFQTQCVDLLDQQLGQLYEDYIQFRLHQYNELFSHILEQDMTNYLQLAALLWEHKLFFEMHELLEKPWKESTGERREALQGLIRAAGMKIHAESGNDSAAFSIAEKAQLQLQSYGKELAGFDRLDFLMDEIVQTLTKLNRD